MFQVAFNFHFVRRIPVEYIFGDRTVNQMGRACSVESRPALRSDIWIHADHRARIRTLKLAFWYFKLAQFGNICFGNGGWRSPFSHAMWFSSLGLNALSKWRQAEGLGDVLAYQYWYFGQVSRELMTIIIFCGSAGQYKFMSFGLLLECTKR